MKISTKGRYAIRMMLDLAEHDQEGFVALKDIAARQEISKKYLEQIVPLLNKANMLLTNRGFQGGYKLAKKPEEYKIGDILRVTEGNLSVVTCLDTPVNTCNRKDNCQTLQMWQGLNDVINDYLDHITLADLCENHMDMAILI
jgi:Rrf2 family protein